MEGTIDEVNAADASNQQEAGQVSSGALHSYG